MKKIFLILFLLVLTLVYSVANAETVLKSGVSVEHVPNAFYGSWRVEAQLEKTTNYSTFKPRSVDLWNLSRLGNVITLENPFTQAKATIEGSQVEENVIVFTKTSSYDNKVLKDVVTIRLNGDTFAGYNDIIFETRSLIDGHVLYFDTAKYLIKGQRVSGSFSIKK